VTRDEYITIASVSLFSKVPLDRHIPSLAVYANASTRNYVRAAKVNHSLFVSLNI
jgi:hypothetical protein